MNEYIAMYGDEKSIAMTYSYGRSESSVSWGGAGERGQITSDWTIIQDGRWKAAIWLNNISRWWMEQDQAE